MNNSSIMKKNFFLIIVALAGFLFCGAQEKRALLIGIDTYTPPDEYEPSSTVGRTEFMDLAGCVNDARSMQSIITSRFKFSTDKIDTLFNTDATRDAILKQINALLEKSKPGDIAFLYYAGHGSQIRNSSSKEADKKDETMVPSNTWKQGVQDIRDKELAKLYNKFIDKGVKLTVIFDCCHSGSLSRGPQDANPPKFRYIAESNYDAKDPSQPTPPETRKEGTFLIMSAAQDNG
ncbi:MAG: caspase family protein, partial [Chitinophagaceae bacterium]